MVKDSLINAFAQIGLVFKSVGDKKTWPGNQIGLTEEEYQEFDLLVSKCHIYNGWFTEDSIRLALREWAVLLTKKELDSWLDGYQFKEGKKIAVIAAGNIPMVGLLDSISILLSGNYLMLKCSSDDDKLIPAILKLVSKFDQNVKESYEIVEGRMTSYEAVIATGSNNSSDHFKQYFSNVPNIIRKNRSSIAIIGSDTTPEDMKELGKDIFTYFGLGCRNVSRLFVPEDFVLDRFFEGMFEFKEIVNHHKYANNYDYQRAIHLMNGDEFLDNGFVMTKEDTRLHAPLGMIYYQRYKDSSEVDAFIEEHKDELQCIVGKGFVEFGGSQKPSLTDYPDNIDILEFIQNL
jgi:hypothetical protein